MPVLRLATLLFLCFLTPVASTARAADNAAALTVAISLDIPPYVMAGATKGLEVDLLRGALPGQKLHFIQMPYGDLETAVPRGVAEVAVAVTCCREGVFYSNDFITFANFAFSKKAAGLAISKIAELGPQPVLTWQGAYRELGPAFKALFAPGASAHGNYREFANQSEQVAAFWADDTAVAVIDRAIFRYFTEATGHTMEDVALHALFPPVTNFRVAFKDPAVGARFNAGIAALCKNGQYAKLLAKNRVVLRKTVCDGL